MLCQKYVIWETVLYAPPPHHPSQLLHIIVFHSVTLALIGVIELTSLMLLTVRIEMHLLL